MLKNRTLVMAASDLASLCKRRGLSFRVSFDESSYEYEAVAQEMFPGGGHVSIEVKKRSTMLDALDALHAKILEEA